MPRFATPEDVSRLAQIRDEIAALAAEAECLVLGTSEQSRADAYWLAHIRTAIGERGTRTVSPTMRDTIEELRAEIMEDGGEDDDDI